MAYDLLLQHCLLYLAVDILELLTFLGWHGLLSLQLSIFLHVWGGEAHGRT